MSAISIQSLLSENQDKIHSVLSNIFNSEEIPWKEILYAMLFCIAVFLARNMILSCTHKWFEHALIYYNKNRNCTTEKADTLPVLYIFDKLVSYLLVLVTILGVAKITGVSLHSFTVFSAFFGFGLAFALQNLISNFTSGLIMLLENNLKIGDMVDIKSLVTTSGSTLGWIKAIRSRSTIISTTDGKDIVIPNNTLVENPVINMTLTNTLRRYHIPFYLPINSNPHEVRKVLIEATSLHPLSLQLPQPPDVWAISIEPYGIRCELVVWVNVKKILISPQTVFARLVWETLYEHKLISSDQRFYGVNTQQFNCLE